MWIYLILISRKDEKLFRDGKEKRSHHILKMALTTMFSQSSRRSLCWIIQYLFLFGCPLFPGRDISCFKKELGLGGLHRHLLFQRQRWASGSAQWRPLWTEGIQTPRQDKVKGNWPAWSFLQGGSPRSSFHLFPKAPITLNKQNSVCVRLGPAELGDVRIQGGSGPGGQ